MKNNLPKLYRVSPTSTNSTSTNFSVIGVKFVLVEFVISKFVLVEFSLCTTQLVRFFPGPKNFTKQGPLVIFNLSNPQTNEPNLMPGLEIVYRKMEEQITRNMLHLSNVEQAQSTLYQLQRMPKGETFAGSPHG